MKIKLLFLLLLVFPKSFSQNLESLKTQTEKMYTASYKLDINTIIDLTYPKVFETVDKATMLSAMKSVFDNPSMSLTFVNPMASFKFGDIKKTEGKKFCVIKYNNVMKMTFKKKMETDGISSIMTAMKGTGRYQDIKYDDETKSLLLTGENTMIAISDDSTKNEWTFLNYDSEETFVSIFNSNIKKELGL